MVECGFCVADYPAYAHFKDSNPCKKSDSRDYDIVRGVLI